MDGTSVFSTQFWVGKGMGRFFFSLDLMFGVQDGAHSHCENSDSDNGNVKQPVPGGAIYVPMKLAKKVKQAQLALAKKGKKRA